MNNDNEIFWVRAVDSKGNASPYPKGGRHYTRREAWDKVLFLRSFTDVERIEVYKGGEIVYEETVYDYTDADRKIE